MYKNCVDIARRSSASGRQTTLRWQKHVFIHTRLSRAYLALAIGFLVLFCCANSWAWWHSSTVAILWQLMKLKWTYRVDKK